ncbi:MAG TPA: UDP-glucose 4-epimerase GalE [Candidatus Krumholzibacteria bacterium]|nr:UDP-glucose 4-epimerase GalE [Candidatus Krumholzibacteria bacterium]
MRVLVTGGAGYIGSVTVRQLLKDGHEVTVLDDLSTGHRAAIEARARFVEGRVQDAVALSEALRGSEAVIHFASLSLVSESVRAPRRYFRENLSAALELLEGMERAKVRRLVFSSSAAVYGEPELELIDEDTPLRPVNPYGMSKLMVEEILAEEARANGLSAMALRYFNACGSDGVHGEDHDPETHLIPRLCAALLERGREFVIHGRDFPTADGTAVRDYVHVVDLARAHVSALAALQAPGFEALNLGTGAGASVLEVVRAAQELAGSSLELPFGPRRAGDPARLVAGNERARRRLAWRPERSGLKTILQDAYRWHQEHPQGYSDA